VTRIAYINADPGVPAGGTNGASIHVQEVLRAMLARGAKLDLFVTRLDGALPADLAAVQVHSLPAVPPGDLAARELAALRTNETLRPLLEATYGARGCDLVYERCSLWSYAGMEFARDHGIPGVLEVNAPLTREQATYRGLVHRAAAEAAAERMFGAAQVLIAVSAEVRAFLEQTPAARGKVAVVTNGVNPLRFPPHLEPIRPKATDEFVVGFVGSLKPWHGVEVLVEAFAQLRVEVPVAKLLIVGDGRERASLEAQLRTRGVAAAAEFTGAVPAESIPAWLAVMDVAVATYPALSDFYFSPLKVFEYMAAGLPVVASGIGQLNDLIEPGINGLLVQPGSVAELVAALVRLHGDPSLRARLGRAARERVLYHHTWTAAVDQVFRLAGLSTPAQTLPAATR